MRENNKGITLIALVITIIVMLILVGVTISMAINGGLFDYAGKATGETKNALDAEGQLANGGIEVDGKWYNSIDEYLETKNGGEAVETISKIDSYIGYYADVDGDGTVDGVIYADLAIGGSGSWDGYSYSYEAETDLKDYYVSGSYDGTFGNEKEVLTAKGEGNDRFYVMALSDFTEGGGTYCWYYSAEENENTEIVTSEDFGTGKSNTATMIEKWNVSAYGTQNGETLCNDIWGQIKTQVSGGWFVPSFSELLAFFGEFNIDDGNCDSYGIHWYYWSSSQASSSTAWFTYAHDDTYFVRL